MKQIISIAQPHRLEQIEQALHGLDYMAGFTIFQAHGHSRGRGAQHAFVATEWNPAVHTGLPGDGLIAVSKLGDALRIRSGERGDAAL